MVYSYIQQAESSNFNMCTAHEQECTGTIEEWRCLREEQDRAYAEALQNDEQKQVAVARKQEVRHHFRV